MVALERGIFLILNGRRKYLHLEGRHRSYGFCILSSGNGKVPGGGATSDTKELGEKAALAPADQGKEPAGYARVWPEHL